MDSNDYAQRIGYEGPLGVSEEILTGLCRAQLASVPFENFDIHLGVPIRLDTPSLFQKIVRRRRGGICYELNGLFAEFLRAIGFEVSLLSARVLRDGVDSGPEFDHMALAVVVGAQSYLVDVGFGDGSTLPLPLHAGLTSLGDRSYELSARGGELLYTVESASVTRKGYVLSQQPRTMSDFYSMCRYHQVSPRSWFTKSLICVRSEPSTIRVIDGCLRRDGDADEHLTDAGCYLAVLRADFGIDLPRLPEPISRSAGWRIRREALRWRTRAHKALQRVEEAWPRTAAWPS